MAGGDGVSVVQLTLGGWVLEAVGGGVIGRSSSDGFLTTNRGMVFFYCGCER